MRSQAIEQGLQTGEVQTVEYSLPADQGTRTYEARIVGSTENTVLSIVRDITERRRAEETLRASETRYRAVVEDMPALICRFLPDGTLTFVNDHHCEYFEQQREDLEGHNFFQFIPEDGRASVRRHYDALTLDQPAVTYEHQVVSPDGTLRYQRWTDRALFHERGQPIEYQSIGEDVTEHKLADEVLARSGNGSNKLRRGQAALAGRRSWACARAR